MYYDTWYFFNLKLPLDSLVDNSKSGPILGAKSNYSFSQKVTGTMRKQKWPVDLAMCHVVIGHLVYACMDELLTKLVFLPVLCTGYILVDVIKIWGKKNVGDYNYNLIVTSSEEKIYSLGILILSKGKKLKMKDKIFFQEICCT